MNSVAAAIFALTIVHTFAAKSLERIADRSTKPAGLFHLLGEIEIAFGLWAAVLQQWWLQPIVSRLEPTALFFCALALTTITGNATLTYLGLLIEGVLDPAKYMLVAGAVSAGGLTVIANAPNPAGVALLLLL